MLAVLGVEAVGILILFEDFADDDGVVLARVDRDLACRLTERLEISTPVFWSSFCTRSFFRTSVARSIGAIRRIIPRVDAAGWRY